MGIPEILANPWEEKQPPAKDLLPLRRFFPWGLGGFHVNQLADAILKGKAGGYPADRMTCHVSDTTR